MKKLLIVAAAVAAFASASSAFAHDSSSGHWEWRNRPQFGPNKSNLPPPRLRVWVKDAPTVANCDCAMMRDQATAADCMAMPHKGMSPSKG